MRRFWIRSLVLGVVGGMLVAVVMAYLDWRLNPGGIFHDAQGTRWPIVLETAMSWFVPVWIAVSVGALIATWWLERRPRRGVRR